MNDIASEIWKAAVPGEYPATAEGRADVDRNLKAALDRIDDQGIRDHAAYIIRATRIAAMRGETRFAKRLRQLSPRPISPGLSGVTKSRHGTQPLGQ